MQTIATIGLDIAKSWRQGSSYRSRCRPGPRPRYRGRRCRPADIWGMVDQNAAADTDDESRLGVQLRPHMVSNSLHQQLNCKFLHDLIGVQS